MDSLTQLLLGAGVGAAIGGKKYGKKSALIGAVMSTVPDLDVVFLTNMNPIESMKIHRGWSHSLLLALIGTPIFAYIISKIKYFKASFKDGTLHLLIFLTFFTHIILDAMTIYGTQIFWPLNTPPVGIGSIFIIDLLYTLPLIVAVIWFLINKSATAIKVGLIISTLYLLWSFAAQQIIERKIVQNYNGEIQQILVQPTPFNTLLWRVLITDDENYHVGYISLFDDKPSITYKSYPLNRALEEPLNDIYALTRMQWFSKEFYGLKEVDNQVILSDLRMGLEPDQYVFQFVIAERKDGELIEIINKRYSNRRDLSRLKKVWARIWDDKVEL